MLIVIRGAIKTILVDDEKNVIDAQEISPVDGVYGVQIPRTYGNTIECLGKCPKPGSQRIFGS